MAAMLRQALQEKIGLDPDIFAEDDPVELFADYIQACRTGDVDEDQKNELLADVVDELDELRLNLEWGRSRSAPENRSNLRSFG